jgi:membrane-bound PQQ-dependent dehydrogenase (glucose/quinate/shikimate family)
MINHEAPRISAPRSSLTAGADGDGQWQAIGQNLTGHRFSSVNDITRDNVGKLERVWVYEAPKPKKDPSLEAEFNGPMTHAPGRRDEATPLAANGKLYVCTAENVVIALDAETGKLKWMHDPHINTTGVPSRLCRGVAYFEDAKAKICPRRILTGTLDLRLLALNADTGEPCADFGQNGTVSLKTGMGDFKPGLYYPTSPPTVVNGVAVMGAMVVDNVSTGEPSGVIRGFDAHTGKLVWAWDMGRPGNENAPLKAGEIYTKGTPNAWTFFAGDEALGLVYVPTGNATPDNVGAHRKKEWEKYSSAIVALDARTGAVKWSFQTTHHDLWDYDVASQPVLYEMPTPKGTVPALIQTTKRGQIYIFDRRDGTPLLPIQEKPVPQTDVPGEWTSKTQPYSVGMPDLAGPRLRESDMWGISPFDQLLCRIQFKHVRYEGEFTPPSLKGSLQYPGLNGGSSWGSVTLDPERNLLIAPSLRMSFIVKLIKREPNMKDPKHSEPQYGTPYLTSANIFFTKLYVPCQAPPYGLISAIDLTTRKVVWEKPLGTAEELGPRGLKSHLPFTIGTAPIVGGAIATAGDVIFIGAAADNRLRAIDTLTGRVLWSDKLPVTGQATPMTYRSPKTGRQMVVIVSGGGVNLLGQGDHVMHVVSYALPK